MPTGETSVEDIMNKKASDVPELTEGTPIKVPRTYAHYVIMEYGIANLRLIRNEIGSFLHN